MYERSPSCAQQLEVQLVVARRREQLVGDLRHELRLAGRDHRGGAGRRAGIGRVALLQLPRERRSSPGRRARPRAARSSRPSSTTCTAHQSAISRHGELARPRASVCAVVERARELVAGVERGSAALLLDPLAVVDVGRGADPEVDRAVVVADRDGAAEVPAVRRRRRARKRYSTSNDVAARERLLAPRDRRRQVVGVDDAVPRRSAPASSSVMPVYSNQRRLK